MSRKASRDLWRFVITASSSIADQLLFTAQFEDTKEPGALQSIAQNFAKIKEMSVNKNLPARCRFMLLDLIELRNHHWQSRKVQAVPVKKEDIQEQIAQEAAQKAAEPPRAASRQNSRGGQGGDDREFGGKGKFKDRERDRGRGRGGRGSRGGAGLCMLTSNPSLSYTI